LTLRKKQSDEYNGKEKSRLTRDIQLPIQLGNGVDLRVGSRPLLIVLVKFHWNLESLAAGDVSECMMGCSL